MLKSQIDFWKTSSRLVIAGVPAMIGETRESAGLEEFRRLDENPPDINTADGVAFRRIVK